MKHCMIVDDSGSIRKVAHRILDDMKMRSSEAETHSEALQMCRTEVPDCIVVDWQMPDGEAFPFMTKLRAMCGADTRIMYLTSENDPADVARAMRCGADGHLMKPFDAESFARPLAEAGLA